MDKSYSVLGVLAMMFAMIGIVALLLGLPTMLLWNWLMPMLFGLKSITFWQAIGLNILSGILFKSTSSNTKSS